MAHHRIPLASLPWQRGGHPLERKKTDPATPVTLLEFAPGFSDPSWCERGHSGHVLEGVLRMEYEAGGGAEEEDYARGEAFHIDPGTRHRASNPGGTTAIIFVVSTPVDGV